MHSLSLIAIATTAALFGFVWHDQPTRTERGEDRSDSAPCKVERMSWTTIAVGIFVVVTFTAFFFAGYAIWMKCHGR